MYRAKEHKHPLDQSQVIYGQELEPQEIVVASDLRPDLTTGRWVTCHDFVGYRAMDLELFGPVIRPTHQ